MASEPLDMTPLENGRRVRGKGDPVVDQIIALRAECRAAGVPYPRRKVEDFFTERFVWWGPVAYAETDLAILYQPAAMRGRPINLPPDLAIDGETRLPGESKDSYIRYLAYRDLGPERTIGKLGKSLNLKNTQSLTGRCSQFHWEARAKAWDAGIEAEIRASAQVVLQNQMQIEVERRHTYLENEWQIVEKGFGVVHEMLKYPVIEKKSERTDAQGMTHVTVWQPGKWTYSAMAQLIEALTKIGRLHSGLSTSNTAQKTEDLSDRSGKNDVPLNADEEAMHRFASERAEEAYFSACEEWKARKQEPLRAMVVA